jgi:hypothetical protein
LANDRPTYPPKPRPKLASHDDLEAVQLADENERLRVRLAAAEQARAAPRMPQERAPATVPPPSAPAAFKVHVSDWKGLASFVGMLASLGLGGSAWMAKAPTERVEAQDKTIGQNIVPVQSDHGDRIAALEKKTRRLEKLDGEVMDYVIQIMADGKIAIVARPDGLPPPKHHETYWSQGLPGQKSKPILIVDSPWPTLQYVSE